MKRYQQEVFDYLTKSGPATSTQVARGLGITPIAARFRLLRLRQLGLVIASPRNREKPPGRHNPNLYRVNE